MMPWYTVLIVFAMSSPVTAVAALLGGLIVGRLVIDGVRIRPIRPTASLWIAG